MVQRRAKAAKENNNNSLGTLNFTYKIWGNGVDLVKNCKCLYAHEYFYKDIANMNKIMPIENILKGAKGPRHVSALPFQEDLMSGEGGAVKKGTGGSLQSWTFCEGCREIYGSDN